MIRISNKFMIIKTILILMIASFSFNAWALNELGALADAQKNHPSVFVPNSVLTYQINNIWGYVFSGEAERDFKDKLAEPDSDLFREALLHAKRNLLNYFIKKDDSLGYSMSACTILYQYIQGNSYRVIWFVERKNIEKFERMSESNKTNLIEFVEFSPPVIDRRSKLEKMFEGKCRPMLDISINQNPLLKKFEEAISTNTVLNTQQ